MFVLNSIYCVNYFYLNSHESTNIVYGEKCSRSPWNIYYKTFTHLSNKEMNPATDLKIVYADDLFFSLQPLFHITNVALLSLSYGYFNFQFGWATPVYIDELLCYDQGEESLTFSTYYSFKEKVILRQLFHKNCYCVQQIPLKIFHWTLPS